MVASLLDLVPRLQQLRLIDHLIATLQPEGAALLVAQQRALLRLPAGAQPACGVNGLLPAAATPDVGLLLKALPGSMLEHMPASDLCQLASARLFLARFQAS